MSPRFSIVIPTYQRRDLVVAAVRALEHQEYDGGFEVIVVIDGSTDGTARALRELVVSFSLIVLEQRNMGAATARNVGSAKAAGEILLFLDDDMEADPRLLAEHDRSHKDGAEVVFGHLPLHPRSPENFLSAGIKWWTDERFKRLSTPDETLTLHDLLTGQMSLSRELFNRVGGFDPRFTQGGTFGGEDIDFGYRLMRAGHRLLFNPRAISWQRYVVKPGEYLRQWHQAGKSDVAFARKHPEQAATIFALNGSEKWCNRFVWRPLTALLPFSLPLISSFHWLALTLVTRWSNKGIVTKFFYQVWAMQYWRGVRESGGMPKRKKLRVLAYHAIRDLAEAPVVESYGMPPRQFARQMDLLQRAGFRFVTADEFLQFLNGGECAPRWPLLLTFDDGYAELEDTVLPILKERGIPAVAFIVSGRVGGTNEWDENIGAPRLPLLDLNGLRRLSQEEVEIGAHSRTHKPLTQLPDEQLMDEVVGSVSDLQANGLNRPRLFAYPEGDHDNRVRGAARNAQLSAAFTVDAGHVNPGHDPFEIPRIEIMRGDTGWRFLWKVIKACPKAS